MTWDTERERLRLKYRLGDGFTLPGAEKHYPPDLELEPIHLDIDLDLDLDTQSAAGTVTNTVAARHTGPDQLTLHAVGLEDVQVRDTDGRELAWSYDGSELKITWADSFDAGEERRVAVSYRVERPAGGLYFSKPTEAYPDEALFAITDHETERARHWLPCVDLPNARPRLDFHLRAPAELTILANGELVGEEVHDDGTKTAHWRLDFPCPSYLTCFAVGDFVRAEDGEFRGRPLAYFAPREFTEDDLRRSFGRTGEMLEYLAEKLDMELPYPKYFQFAATGVGGAMENISLVSWDDRFVMDETLAKEWTRLLDEINLHEMSHSYFGDAVVCRDYAHAWLKESWATYMEQVWFGDVHGEDERQLQYFRDAQTYFQEADKRYKRPIVTRTFNSSWDMYDAHLYPGGACRLHTLECELGEDVFWEAVRDYLKRYRGRVVETDDFRHVLEEHSGRSLGRFFDQWFHSVGYPKIKVAFKYDAKRKEGTFEVTQTQVEAKGGGNDGKGGEAESEPVFEMRTDVGWVIDGQSHTYAVRLSEAKHSFIVPMAKEPEQVRFDPLGKVLSKIDFNPGDGKLRKQLTHAPDVIGRILAAQELCKTGKRKNVEAVRDAYKEEPFWGVRQYMAAALGKAGVESAVEALAELVEWEQDPMVLAALMRAAGKYRDGRLREAVEARLDADMPYYYARSAAYQVLGAQRADAPLDRLVEAASVEGFGGIVQAGAFQALGASRAEAALEVLLGASAYGATSNRSRPAAVMALGSLARYLEKEPRARAVEQLEDLLRDPVLRVRQAALMALRAAQASEAIGAIEAVRGPLPQQEQVRIDRVVTTIRKAAEPRDAARDKQMDELRTALRKLRDQIEHLESRVETLTKAQAAEGEDAGNDDDAGSEEGRTKDGD